MTDPGANRRNRRILVPALIGVAILTLFIGAAWYLSSARFHAAMRAKVIEELENITGGRVELGSFTWNLSQLQFEGRDLTLHGLEGPDEAPYARISRIQVRAKILSLLGRELGLRYVAIDKPIIHLIVYPDGTTNQPTPKIKSKSDKTPVQRLFDLAINRLDLREGELLLNDSRIPLDFSVADLTFGMTYDLIAKRYDGTLHIGKLDTKFQNLRPVSSQAELQFSLWPNAAQINSLRLSTASSQLEASGRLRDFNDPKLDLTYSAKLNLAEVGGIARLAELRRGVLELNGTGSYTRQAFSSAGKLFVKELEYRDPVFELSNAEAGADYVLDQERLKIRQISAMVMGGNATGDAELVNWTAPAAPKEGGRKAEPGKSVIGTTHLKIGSLSLAQLVTALSSRSLPLKRMNVAGVVSGTLDASWRGALSNATAQLALDVTAPAQSAAEQVPVNAAVRAVYRGAEQVVEVPQLSLATRATRLDAAGRLGTTSAELRVAINTSDFAEFRPVIAAMQASKPGTQPLELPLQLHGRAFFTGTVRGKLSAPALAGHLEIADFDSLTAEPGQVFRASGAPARTHRTHWDLLSADVQYSSSLAAAHKGVLRRGNAQVNFDGSAKLQKGQFTETTPLNLRANIRNADLRELQTLAGYDYPISGSVNLLLHLSGTQRDPRGEGKLKISNLVVKKESFESLSSDIVFANHEAQLANFVLAHNGAQLTGSAGYNLTTTEFRLDARGANIDLGQVKELQTEKLRARGLLSFSAHASGTKERPIINANVQLRNLVLNNETVGDLSAEAVTQGENLRVSARSNFANAGFSMDGDVQLRGDFPAKLELHFGHLNIDPILHAYMKGRLTGHSQLAGDISVQGPLRRPRELNVTGNLDRVFASLENIRIQNEGPVRFTIADQVARLERLHLVGDDTDITATGTMQLAGRRQLNLRSEGRINLHLLQSVNPDFTADGTVNIAMNVSGTRSRPYLNGQMTVANGAISYIELPNGLADINGTLVFNQDRVQIASLTARTGGGILNLGGWVGYGNTLTFNVTAEGRDVRLRYPRGVSAAADIDLRLSGSLQNSLLSGDVTVTKFSLNTQFDLGLALARSKQAPELPNPKSPLNNLHLDVRVVSTPQLQLQTALARISGDADLRLRGSGTQPVILGRVNVVEGDFLFNGTKYHMERGDVRFTNPVRIEPVLDLEATARVRDYDITLGFHGPADKLNTTYRSDPPLPVADIINLLALGRTREEQAAVQQQQSSPNFTESASNAILGSALNSVVSSRVQKLFGVSRIKIDPQVGGPENNPNARLTIEQQVSNNITLTYITDLTRSNQQAIQIEYNVNRNVSIIAVRDLNGVLGFDVRVRQRKK